MSPSKCGLRGITQQRRRSEFAKTLQVKGAHLRIETLCVLTCKRNQTESMRTFQRNIGKRAQMRRTLAEPFSRINHRMRATGWTAETFREIARCGGDGCEFGQRSMAAFQP